MNVNESESRVDLTKSDTEREIDELVECFRRDLGNLAEHYSRKAKHDKVTVEDVNSAAVRIVDVYYEHKIYMELTEHLLD